MDFLISSIFELQKVYAFNNNSSQVNHKKV